MSGGGEGVVGHGYLQRERVEKRLEAVGGQQDDGAIEARGREQRATGQQHVVHQELAQRVAKERRVRGDGNQVAEQLLGQLRLTPSCRTNIAHVHGGQLLVAEGGVEQAVALELLVDGGVAVLQVLRGKGAGNELGAVGAVSALGEEEVVVGIGGLLAHQTVGGEVVGDEQQQRVGHGEEEIGTDGGLHQLLLALQQQTLHSTIQVVVQRARHYDASSTPFPTQKRGVEYAPQDELVDVVYNRL